MVGMPNAPRDGTEPLPPGTTITTILPNLTNGPVSMAFDPQGRLFFTEKGQATSIGAVRLYANGTLQASPVITFSVSAESERGLLGIALDPSFNANHFIYVYYTSPTSSEPPCANAENRVVRFVESGGVGFNPTRIFWSCQDAGNHNGGNIHFGPDGKLYISIGDNANAANAQNVTVKNGKMHRINSDGSIPSDNPVFTQTGALPSLYVMGLRNSFDFVIDPLTAASPYPRIFASENGPSCDDEMNRIQAGYNYGWRASYPCDDPNPSPVYNTIAPLWFLPNGACCDAPTGITIYTGQQIPPWHNELFMAAFNNGNLRHFYLNPQRTLVTQTNIVQGISAAGDIETGPDGAFWYFQESPYSPQVNLMRLSGPGATSTPNPTSTIGPSSTPTPFHTPTPCTLQFSDVPVGSTFYNYIHCLACQGIVNGYPDDTFQPNNNVSRGQLSKIVANAAGFDSGIPLGQQTFQDVPLTSSFYSYIERLSMAGIVQGYPCGGPGEPCVSPGNRPYFRPGNNATRGQITKIISDAAGFNDALPPGTQTFQDVPEGSTFFTYTERLLLNRPGVMQGYPCGGSGEPCLPPDNRPYFRPGNNATRGQTSKIVSNTFFPNCVVPLRVTIEQFSYHPADVTIPAGTVVRFINRDAVGHTATAVDSSFDTGNIPQNQFRDVTFDTVGDFEYYCIPHPSMRGFVHVTPAR